MAGHHSLLIIVAKLRLMVVVGRKVWSMKCEGDHARTWLSFMPHALSVRQRLEWLTFFDSVLENLQAGFHVGRGVIGMGFVFNADVALELDFLERLENRRDIQ